jgi:hypothetical protein
MEIEHDRFAENEPFVVSVWLEGVSDGETWDALATATPTQARQMADALRHYADEAEHADARLEALLNPTPSKAQPRASEASSDLRRPAP